MPLPGNLFHQTVLQILVDLFKKDQNIEAFGVFGSLVRGDWDEYSDLDLDVVVKDDSDPVVNGLVAQVLSALKEGDLNVLLCFEEAKGERIIIFDTLDRISIRFHSLSDTKPQVLDTLTFLCGRLTKENIHQSVKEIQKPTSLELLANKFVELAVYVPIGLHRDRLVNAQFFLNKMRQTLIEIYSISHGLSRGFDFEAHASKELIKELTQTYARLEKGEIIRAHEKLMKLFLEQLDAISNGKIKLTAEKKIILEKAINY